MTNQDPEINQIENEIEENPDFAGQSQRQIQVGLQIRSLAQDFFQKESSGNSLITITKANISRDLKNASFFITVLPESKENAALSFAKRKRTDLRTYLKSKLKIRTIPYVDIEIDQGEKIRMKIGNIKLS